MTFAGWSQLVLFVAVLTALVAPLGGYRGATNRPPPTDRMPRVVSGVGPRFELLARLRSTFVKGAAPFAAGGLAGRRAAA